MNIRLDNKVALITGASRGLGASMAQALAGAGAHVALVGRDTAKLNEVAEKIRSAGGTAEPFQADVTKEGQVLELEKDIAGKLGKVSILINNAGVNCRKNITDFTLDEWNGVIETNLTAAFLMCRSFVPHMKGTGYGRIINMTSIMGHISLPQRAAYSASKSGLMGLTRAVALELATEGITCVGISPGPFATEMNLPLLENPELNAAFVAKIPAGKWGKVEDIGTLALYLCSDAASFITGSDILIDGGWCAQ